MGLNVGRPFLGLSLDQHGLSAAITAKKGYMKSGERGCRALKRGTWQVSSFLPDFTLPPFNLIPFSPLHSITLPYPNPGTPLWIWGFLRPPPSLLSFTIRHCFLSPASLTSSCHCVTFNTIKLASGTEREHLLRTKIQKEKCLGQCPACLVNYSYYSPLFCYLFLTKTLENGS